MELQQGALIKNIVIVEGFEMVGKSTVIENLLVKDNGFVNYHATHDLTDKTVGRNNSWTIGYGVLDFLKQCSESSRYDLRVAIDRGVLSSYVYQELYGPSGSLDPKVIEFYRNDPFFHQNITHIYVTPRDQQVSQMLWESSKRRPKNPNALSDKYDQFESFEDYWRIFKKANELFKKAYDLLNIKPYVVQVEPDGDYTIWK